MRRKTIALIPARLGSKGLKQKNILDIGTLPMFVYSILAARGVPEIDDVYVSSEAETVLQLAIQYGARPLRRPEEFATDRASTEQVVQHFLDEVSCSTVVLIQPTSPMLLPCDLKEGLELYKTRTYQSIFSAYKTYDMLVWDEEGMYPLNYDPKLRGRRQDRRRSLLVENGAFYIFSLSGFKKTRCRLHGRIGYYEMPFWRSFQVDDKIDMDNIRTLMTSVG